VNWGLIQAAKNEGQLAESCHEIGRCAAPRNEPGVEGPAQAGLSLLGGLVGKNDRSTEQTIATIGGSA
jgi:hypothetical protein